MRKHAQISWRCSVVALLTRIFQRYWTLPTITRTMHTAKTVKGEKKYFSQPHEVMLLSPWTSSPSRAPAAEGDAEFFSNTCSDMIGTASSTSSVIGSRLWFQGVISSLSRSSDCARKLNDRVSLEQMMIEWYCIVIVDTIIWLMEDGNRWQSMASYGYGMATAGRPPAGR